MGGGGANSRDAGWGMGGTHIQSVKENNKKHLRKKMKGGGVGFEAADCQGWGYFGTIIGTQLCWC